ncbi:MAG: J domain-containing protein [Desulfotignum sp.]
MTRYKIIMDIQKALKLLDLEPDATLEDARAAFKKKAKQFHPDKLMAASNAGDDGEKMKDINVAYHTLKTVLKPGVREKTPNQVPKRLPAACRHLVDAFRKWISDRHILSQTPPPRKPARTSQAPAQEPGAFEQALKQSMRRRVAGERGYSAYARYLELERKMKQARHHPPGTDWEVDKVDPVSRIKPVK